MPDTPLPVDESRRLEALERLRVLDTPPEARFDRITRTAARVFQVPIAFVALVGEDRVWIKSAFGIEPGETRRDTSFCAYTILSPETLVVPDTTVDPRFFRSPLVVGAPWIRTYAGRPLRGPDGHLVGTLAIADTRVRVLTIGDLEQLADLAVWVEHELGADHLRETLVRRTARITRVGGWELDLETGTPLWTEEVYRIHELEATEPPNLEQALTYFGPEVRPILRDALMRAVLEGTPYDLELPFTTARGRRRWVRTICEPELKEGRCIRLCGTFQDITQRKSIELQLERHGRMLRVLSRAQAEFITASDSRSAFGVLLEGFLSMSASPAGFLAEVVFDGERGPVLRVHACQDMDLDGEGRRRIEEATAAGIEMRVLPPLFEAVLRSGRPAMSRARWDEAEVACLPPGHPPPSTAVVIPLFQADQLVGLVSLSNRVSGYDQNLIDEIEPLLATCANLIVARRSEQSRRRSQQELRASEARLRALFDTVGDAIITTDDQGRIESINPATERLFGWTAAELMGQDLSLLMPAPDRIRHAGYLARYRETGEARIIGIGREVEGCTRDGGRFPLELSVGEMWIDGRRHFTGIIRDISARKRVERALAEQNEELERANRMKTEFLANMSHELRTPLNAIIGFSEVLKDGLMGELTVEQRDYVREIFESGRHLLSLINDILDLSKIEAGRMTLDLEPIDASELFAQAAFLLGESAHARGLRLSCAVDPALQRFEADGRKLRQILYNLLSNAIKFTGPGGEVRLQARRVNGAGGATVEISVEDTGIGIPAEDQERLFEPFYQVDASIARRYGGTGLGLAMVKRLAELHGGGVGVESEPGRGSRFVVHLPLRECAGTVYPPELEPAAGSQP